MLHELTEQDLQIYVARSGGADSLLYLGRKNTESIDIHFDFAPNKYHVALEAAADDTLIVAREEVAIHAAQEFQDPLWITVTRGSLESKLKESSQYVARYVRESTADWRVYHFHDTSDGAKVKGMADINDNRVLRPDASNLAAFLLFLREKQSQSYMMIVRTMRQIAPFFKDFELDPDRYNGQKIQLRWVQAGSDQSFPASALSDGTLRFICLTTLLLQPQLPSTILVDEPELGLHPSAIMMLAALLRSASQRTQIVVSTQSVPLVNQFNYDDLIVVDREREETLMRRLLLPDVERWLEDYSLGEIWEKNIIGGRP